MDAGDQIFSSRMKVLFLFLDDPRIPPMNNTSEQALRWSVIFRKITNGFRSDWERDVFACIRFVVNTEKRQGLSMLDSILITLDPSSANRYKSS